MDSPVDTYNPPLNYKPKEQRVENKQPELWTFNEKQTIARVVEYIADTYKAHYAHGRIQATEFIADQGLAEGFCLGNIIKYAQRFGRKGVNFEDKEYDFCFQKCLL